LHQKSHVYDVPCLLAGVVDMGLWTLVISHLREVILSGRGDKKGLRTRMKWYGLV